MEGPRLSQDFTRRYTISRLIGKGGMGSVYLAWDQELSRQVAIKFLGGIQEAPDSEAGMRFAEEARLCALLKHPAIVRLFSSGWEGQVPYLVFEHIEGLNLAALIGGGRLPVDRSLRIADDLLRGLQKAHEMGVIHRDVKPSNVIIRSEELPAVLVDFGLAKSLHGSSFRTGANVILGTPAYMAPELVRGGAPHAGVDVYATGCLLYECLSGVRPFDGRTDLEILKGHLERVPRPLEELVPGLPEGLGAVVMSALVKDPARRVESAGDLAMALRPFRSDRGLDASTVVTVRRPKPVGIDEAPARRTADDAPAPVSKKASPPTKRQPKRPDETIRVSEGLLAEKPGSETRAVRRAARRLPWRPLAAIVFVSLALFAWAMRDGVTSVTMAAGSDGSLTVSWESRRPGRGRVFVRALTQAAATGSPLVEDGPPSTRHALTARGLEPSISHQVLIQGANGESLWEGRVTTPPAWIPVLQQGPSPGTARVLVPGADVTEGTLVLGEAQQGARLRSVAGALSFDVPYAPEALGDGMRVVITHSEGTEWILPVDSVSELAAGLAEDLRAFDPGPVIGKLVASRDFDPWMDFAKQLGEHPIGALSTNAQEAAVVKSTTGGYLPKIERALRSHAFWPRFERFRPHGPAWFRVAPDAPRVALFSELAKLTMMDLMAASQHDLLNFGIRDLSRGLVQVDHRLGVDPEVTVAGWRDFSLLPRDTCWLTSDFDDWAGLNQWFRSSRLEKILAIQGNLAEADQLRALWAHERAAELPEAASVDRAGTARVRVSVLLLGPSYFYEVQLGTPGQPPALTLLLTQPGTLDWFEEMDYTLHDKPSGSSTPGQVPGVDFWAVWGGITLTFPARLLPAGPLRAITRYRHVPGVTVDKLSNIQRLSFIRRLTLSFGPG